jgi:hypothetical protein
MLTKIEFVWIYKGVFCRSARRRSSSPDWHYDYVGFRAVLAPAQP